MTTLANELAQHRRDLATLTAAGIDPSNALRLIAETEARIAESN